ncbi:MAG: endonuclease domain-containing protein [Candidatus Marinimicrobia bacterium]|nr:endonuclease domain-containing protein [Candidatus Neomarinimicrobiota bacterium]
MKFSDLPPYTQEALQIAKMLRQNTTLHEKIVWNHIRKQQIGYKFRRQVPIGKYVVDFICIELGLIVEINGGYHYKAEQMKKDLKRTRYLERLNIKVMRFNNGQVNTNIDGVIEKLMDVITKTESAR